MAIKLFVMDVDGTLTDGKLYIGKDKEMMKTFCVKDGAGIMKLHASGIVPVIVTGRNSPIVSHRAKELKIKECYQGEADKLQRLQALASLYQTSLAECAYIGDDENDLSCIQACGVSACPSDAMQAVKETVTYICMHKGGEGAVREFVEFVLNASIAIAKA